MGEAVAAIAFMVALVTFAVWAVRVQIDARRRWTLFTMLDPDELAALFKRCVATRFTPWEVDGDSVFVQSPRGGWELALTVVGTRADGRVVAEVVAPTVALQPFPSPQVELTQTVRDAPVIAERVRRFLRAVAVRDPRRDVEGHRAIFRRDR